MPETTLPTWLPVWLHGPWDYVAHVPLALAAAIVTAGVLLAFAGRLVIVAFGSRLTARTSTDLDDKLLRLLARVFASVVTMLALLAAVEALPLSESVTGFALRALGSVLVLLLLRSGLAGSRLVLQVLSKLRDRFPFVEERTIPLFDLLATVLLVGLGAYALLLVWHIDPTAWLASAGIVGIAVGFAARDTLANLFAGFFIIADAPYKLGDYVVLDSGTRGEITKVGIRSTRLLTRDDVEVIIPNALMANSTIVNESGGRWVKYRIRIQVGVAYGSDVEQVVQVLERVAAETGAVCHDPEPRVRMRGFGDSSLDFELLCWVDHPSQRGLVSHQLYMQIYKALATHGIEIPFPQRDLWVKQLPTAAADAAPRGSVTPSPPA